VNVCPSELGTVRHLRGLQHRECGLLIGEWELRALGAHQIVKEGVDLRIGVCNRSGVDC
jgi:hypothetical protein